MMMMISSKTIHDYTIGVYYWESMTEYHAKIVQPYGEIHKWGYRYPNSWMVYLVENPFTIDNLMVPLS